MERGGVGLLGHKKSRIVRAPFTRVLWLSFHIILLELGANPPQLSAQESTILVQLHPYNQGTPHLPTLEPGVTLSRENVPLAKDVLPGEVVQLLTAGDFTIQLQDTTDLPLRQSYIDSTLQRTVEVSLDSPHVLQNYHGGVPFPLLDQNDPQAGEKLAWNFRYRDLGETFEMWPTTSEVNAAGGVEHFDRGIMKIRFGMHRANPTDNDPQWQAQGILLKNSFELLSPSDREGVMRILTVYDDDTHPSEQLRYSPQTRRIRKEYVNYLTPIGGSYEVLQEESPPSFFHGYLHPYQWNYIGTRLMLVPGFAKTTKLQFVGKGGWYPAIPWELRFVHILECIPQGQHPFGRRVFFLDQQTYAPLLGLTYAQTGEFLRLLIVAHAQPASSPNNNQVSLPVLFGGTAINYARQRATLFSAAPPAIYNQPFSAQRFSLLEIFRRGK